MFHTRGGSDQLVIWSYCLVTAQLLSTDNPNWFLIQVCPEENQEREEASQPHRLQAVAETTERPEQRHQVSGERVAVLST